MLLYVRGGYMQTYKEIEKSIIKTYRKEIWSRFIKGVKEYKLIEDNDNIMVCISGGKDSFLMAKCMQELKKHGKINFDVHYVVMNPGYSRDNMNHIIKTAKLLNIDIEVFDTDIFKIVQTMPLKKGCYMCARMRRGYLYNQAKELGCNKIALGHHFDDVIETTLLSMLYGSEIKTMIPKLNSDNFEGLQLIRPLYLVKEQDILNWVKHNDLSFINCACEFTRSCDTSKRQEIKKVINELRKLNPNVDHNIFKSLDNVNLDCVLGYKKNNHKYSFLYQFDK